MNRKVLLVPVLALGLGVPALTQDDSSVKPVNDSSNMPVYRVNVVGRTAKAIDYRHKGGTVDLNMVGTDLM
ncbi:MAG TPA: hypothetical protein VG897_00915, partial [Terriglobales bacterium]|nr:hypothetical protein [Terriglobales bacterium]